MAGSARAGVLFIVAIITCVAGAATANDEQQRACAVLPVSNDALASKASACSAILSSRNLSDADRAKALSQRGYVYFRRSQFEAARRDFSNAIRLAPNEPYNYSARGQAFAVQHQYARAIADFDQALSLAPGQGKVYASRASSYLQLDLYAQAIEDASQAIRLDRTIAEAFAIRGLAHLYSSENSLALQDLDWAISRRQTDESFYFARGMANDAIGRWNLAAQDYESALHLSPLFSGAARARDKDIERMLVVSAVSRTSGNNSRGQFHRRPADAGTSPSRAIGRTHSCDLSYPILSKSLQETGDVLVHYDVTKDGVLTNVGVSESSGSVRLDDAAVTCVSTRWRNTPQYVKGRAVESTFHQAIIRYVLEKPFSGDAESYEIRGRAFEAIGRYDSAILDFDKALQKNPALTNVYYRRGFAHYMLGEHWFALEDLNESIARDPRFSDAIGARELVLREFQPTIYETIVLEMRDLVRRSQGFFDALLTAVQEAGAALRRSALQRLFGQVVKPVSAPQNGERL